ncbi:alpha/beta fold hydrolase [Niveibacterium sp.]|uniref:alpha/beta fold hydrolase n=1 Tax=Niveibacterium sp. TaxID=2017444 RepID=UPI0035B0FFFA
MTGATPTTWVLLRGLTREQGHWGDFPDRLRAALPGSRVLTPDLPGNGQLNMQESPTSVEAMADAVRAQLSADGVAPPYAVLAMSLGAMVAVAWAARYPQELSRIVLINTSLRPFSPFWQRLRPRNYATLLRLAVLETPPRMREAAILRATTRLVVHAEAVLDHWQALHTSRPCSARNALRQLIAAARFRAPRQAPAVPALLLCGQRDALVDSRCSHAIAHTWQRPLAVHPTAGHDLPLDDGDWVIAQVVR